MGFQKNLRETQPKPRGSIHDPIAVFFRTAGISNPGAAAGAKLGLRRLGLSVIRVGAGLIAAGLFMFSFSSCMSLRNSLAEVWPQALASLFIAAILGFYALSPRHK